MKKIFSPKYDVAPTSINSIIVIVVVFVSVVWFKMVKILAA